MSGRQRERETERERERERGERENVLVTTLVSVSNFRLIFMLFSPLKLNPHLSLAHSLSSFTYSSYPFPCWTILFNMTVRRERGEKRERKRKKKKKKSSSFSSPPLAY